MRDCEVTTAAIRVLVDLDGWRADSVERSLESQPDIEVLHRVPPPVALVREDRRHPFDVVVASIGSKNMDRFKGAFFSDAAVPLIAINEEEGRVEVYDRWVVREVEFSQLVAAIREVARHAKPVVSTTTE